MRKRKKLIIVIILIILIAAVAGIKYAGTLNEKINMVKTETAAGKNLIKSISVSGTIEPNSSQEILLSPGQKVLIVYMDENQVVKNGDKLIKLDTTDLEYNLKKGQISLELAKKELEKLKDNENSNTKTTLENTVKQAELSLASAKLKYEEAIRKYENNEKLYEAGFLSKQELNDFEMALRDLENNVSNSKIVYDNSKISLEDFLNNEDNIYRQTKQIEITETDLENLNRNISNSIIKSNIDGIIVKMDAKPEQYPNQGDMVVVHDLSRYKLNVKVGQYDAVNLKENQEAIIKIKGLDKEYKGRVLKVAQMATIEMSSSNRETKVSVDIILINPDENIKVGYEADADIILDEKQNIMSVGFESILTDDEGKKFIFISEDNIAKKRYVQTGLESDFDIEITSGLEAGETYITNPSPELREGDIITVNGGM